MNKLYLKKNFGSAQMAEMKPGERVTVACSTFSEVLSLRSGAVQFVKVKKPEGIARFSSTAEQQEDGTYKVILEAVAE